MKRLLVIEGQHEFNLVKTGVEKARRLAAEKGQSCEARHIEYYGHLVADYDRLLRKIESIAVKRDSEPDEDDGDD